MTQRQKLTFDGHRGNELAARLDSPANPRAYAVLAHCFTCSKDSPATSHIAKQLVKDGIAVLRIDFAGLGHSAGEFAESTFSGDAQDIVAAAEWLEENYQAPQLLIGHSLGGAAALAAAADIDSLRAVVTIAAPYDPEHVTGLFAGALDEIAEDGSASVKIGGKTVCVGQGLVDDLRGFNQKERIAAIDVPLLIMHSNADDLVDIHNAQGIYRAARTTKSFIMLDGVDHLLHRDKQAQHAAQMLVGWATPYLPEVADVDGDDCADERRRYTEDGVVKARLTGDGDFATELRAGSHRWIADEPTSVPGAKNTGPNPYDMLQASLATCTVMTMGMYARRKKWELGDTDVVVTHERDKQGVTTLTRVLHFDDALSAEQRDKLTAISEKCPVHKTLHGEIQIETRDAAHNESQD